MMSLYPEGIFQEDQSSAKNSKQSRQVKIQKTWVSTCFLHFFLFVVYSVWWKIKQKNCWMKWQAIMAEIAVEKQKKFSKWKWNAFLESLSLTYFCIIWSWIENLMSALLMLTKLINQNNDKLLNRWVGSCEACELARTRTRSFHSYQLFNRKENFH